MEIPAIVGGGLILIGVGIGLQSLPGIPLHIIINKTNFVIDF